MRENAEEIDLAEIGIAAEPGQHSIEDESGNFPKIFENYIDLSKASCNALRGIRDGINHIIMEIMDNAMREIVKAVGRDKQAHLFGKVVEFIEGMIAHILLKIQLTISKIESNIEYIKSIDPSSCWYDEESIQRVFDQSIRMRNAMILNAAQFQYSKLHLVRLNISENVKNIIDGAKIS